MNEMFLILIAIGLVFTFVMGRGYSNDENNALFIVANIYYAAALVVLLVKV